MAFRSLFEWSDCDHSLREVVEVFQNQLPVLAIVNEGYSGRDGMHEFASDEVYWIFGIQKQDKVVAKAALERYVSIPVDYPVLFQRIINGRPMGSALSMSTIVSDDDFRGQKIRFKDDVQIPFNFGARDGSFDQFGEMEIIEKYSEKYLLCHSVIKQEIHPLVIGIPAYVPIRMEVACGFTNETKEWFEKWMRDVADKSRNLENSQITLRQEILLFHESPGGDYEYISPMKFTAHSYDTDSESEEEPDIPTWQLPQSTTRPAKKCYTVARNPIKVCIQPIPLPQIPGPGVPREAFAKATRSGILNQPKLPPRFAKTIDRRGQALVLPKSSASLPPKLSPNLTQLPNPPLPPKSSFNTNAQAKSSATLPPKSSLTHVPDTKRNHLKWGRSLDEGDMENNSFGTGYLESTDKRPPYRQNSTDPPSLPPNSSRTQRAASVDQGTSSAPLTNQRRAASVDQGTSSAPLMNQRRAASIDQGTSSGPLTNQKPKLRSGASKFPPDSSTQKTRDAQSKGEGNASVGNQQLKVSEWNSLDDVPANLDISQLSVDGVTRCLELLNLESFVPFFRQMTVDGQMLLELDRQILVDEFGLSKLDALRLTMFVKRWRPNLQQD